NGFDVNIAGNERGHPSTGYFSPFHYPNLVVSEQGVNLTDRLTDEAMRFVEENHEQPFFLYFPYYAVHSPIQPKQDLKAKYQGKEKTAAHGNAAYAAMIENLDDNIGRLLGKLDELQLTKNTLVLLTSDNGGVWTISKQWPLRAGKGAYYEGGIRVPLIVKWPGKVDVASVVDTPICGIDFFPTLAEAAGVSPPADKILDGVSLLPLITGKKDLAQRPLFWHFPIYLQGYAKRGRTETRDFRFRTRPGSVIRYGQWKLHHYFEDGGLELYDLDADPGEQNNLARENSEKTEQLLEMLENWRKETRAPVPTKLNPKYSG
ncbi:MAG: sulfatase-like hydrolase/transferase, partial [Pirellulales bacterium]|nr:sulfatase-like hydrolase/transferase [Pirellulales bacterium]